MNTLTSLSNSLWALGLSPTRLLCPWNFPGKNTGVGWHFLWQRIFPTQGLNPGLFHLLHRQADSWLLTPPGKPLLPSEDRSAVSDSLWPHGLYSLWNSPGQNIGVGFPSAGDLPNPEIEPRSSHIADDSLPAGATGKPQNTGVGSLSPSPGEPPNPGIELGSPALLVDFLPAELAGRPFT